MTLNDYQAVARSTAVYPRMQGFEYCALGLCGEAGEVADKLKKVIRDHHGALSKDKCHEVAKELGDVLWYVANLSAELGYSLEDVAQMNADKLSSRQARGVLGGSGDNR